MTTLSGNQLWEDREVARTALVADVLFQLGATARDQLVVGDKVLQLQAHIGDVPGDVNSISAKLIIVQSDLFVRLRCRILAEGATEALEEVLVEGRATDPQEIAAKMAAHALNVNEAACCFSEIHGNGLLSDFYVGTSYAISIAEPDGKRFPSTLNLEVVDSSQRASQKLLQEQAIEFGTENPSRCFTVGKLAWTELGFFTKASWDADDNVYGSNPAAGEDAPPLWRAHACRWGVNRAELSDGRVVWSGGQFEDSYDPMFCIFNDILVEHPDGRSPELFTYPREVFPPTDYHACVEADGYLYLFGNMGYPEDRTPDRVQVLRLDLTTYAMDRLMTKGWSPPWLLGQRAKLSDSAPRDLKLGMTFVASERPEVHFRGEPFGILVKRGGQEVAEEVPTGPDAEVCEHNIASLNDQFQVCYDTVQRLAPGMRFEVENGPTDIKVRVLSRRGECLGFLCEAFDHYALPLKCVSDGTDVNYQWESLTENNLVEPPDYIIEEGCLEDIEETLGLFLSKPPVSIALGMEPEGLLQKACEHQRETWQSASVEGRNVTLSFWKNLFTDERHKCTFNLDTLAWSEQ